MDRAAILQIDSVDERAAERCSMRRPTSGASYS
jgi:hypothetical protein